MMDLDHPEVSRSIQAASARVEALHVDLLDAHPALRENFAIPVILINYGLTAFVANDLTDDQIVAQVLAIVVQVREKYRKIRPSDAS